MGHLSPSDVFNLSQTVAGDTFCLKNSYEPMREARMTDVQVGSQAADRERIQYLWPEDGKGPLAVVFEFEEHDSAWKCQRITIEPMDHGQGGDVLTPAALAPLRLGRMLRQARAGIWTQRVVERAFYVAAKAREGIPLEDGDWTKVSKSGRRDRRGAAPLAPEYLAQVADVFNVAESQPGRTKPVLAVMEHFGLPRSTAARHIRRAREIGRIGPRRNRGNLGGSQQPKQSA